MKGEQATAIAFSERSQGRARDSEPHRIKNEETPCRSVLSHPSLLRQSLSLAGSAYSQAQFGTAAEAGAIEKKAVAELKANEAAALEKFNSATGGFRDRDLYVFCYNMTSGAFTAHINKALIGTDVRTLKEKDEALPLGQRIFDQIKASPEGTITTVSYNFPKPGTQNPVGRKGILTWPALATRAAASAIISNFVQRAVRPAKPAEPVYLKGPRAMLRLAGEGRKRISQWNF